MKQKAAFIAAFCYCAKMTMVIYTFRTVYMPAAIKEMAPVFVLNSLKEDLTILIDYMDYWKPDLIVGIGNGQSIRYESLAQNNFHGHSIRPDGPKDYRLFVPQSQFAVSRSPTSSFCNWAAYNVAYAARKQQDKPSRYSFLHITRDFWDGEWGELTQLRSLSRLKSP